MAEVRKRFGELEQTGKVKISQCQESERAHNRHTHTSHTSKCIGFEQTRLGNSISEKCYAH